MKNNAANSLVLAAAFAGLVGGTTARLQAQPASGSSTSVAGVMLSQNQPDLPKHSCKGKNDCKGQGGGDAKHYGKNDCKGKGACATDGSKPSKS